MLTRAVITSSKLCTNKHDISYVVLSSAFIGDTKVAVAVTVLFISTQVKLSIGSALLLLHETAPLLNIAERKEVWLRHAQEWYALASLI